MRGSSESRIELVDRIRAILASRQLTLSDVSRYSRTQFGQHSPYFVPHNFLAALQSPVFSPSLAQVCTFSNLSGYRLLEWLLVFGFQLEDVARLQLGMNRKRTIIIDQALMDPNFWAAYVATPVQPPPRAVLPLARLVPDIRYARRGSSELARSAPLLAKIGSQDVRSYPEIYPGSLILAEPKSSDDLQELGTNSTSKDLFLVEYSGGLVCCHVHRTSSSRVVLASSQLTYPHLELRIKDEVRALAKVRLEVRFLNTGRRPEVPQASERSTESDNVSREALLPEALRLARERSALSIREASLATKAIAAELKDNRYFVASGSLSEYEQAVTAPRRIHKILSLCIVLGIPFRIFLRSIGFSGHPADGEAMPDQFLRRDQPRTGWETSSPRLANTSSASILMDSAIRGLLNDHWADAVAIRHLGINDLYWIQGAADAISPHLDRGIVAVVNRHKKKPTFCPSKPAWQQPLYLVLHRDGSYECACCSREGQRFLLHPCWADVRAPRILRSGIDAELVGRIVAVVRRFA